MTTLHTLLLVSGIVRVLTWSIGVVVCRRIGSRIGVASFSLVAALATVNTLRDVGAIDPLGVVSHIAQIMGVPAAALMVLTLILNHRKR